MADSILHIALPARAAGTAWDIPCTVHAAAAGSATSGIALLYFHGGGFLYGQRDDLPQRYIDMICSRGHALVCIDYPLAPETPLAEIVEVATGSVEKLASDALPALGCKRFALFGRSAGAYLALIVAKRLGSAGDGVGEDPLSPLAIWDFYGYYDLGDRFVTAPAPFYAKLPAVGDAVAQRLVGACGAHPVSAPKEQRYALYVHARQTGCWKDLLGVADGAEAALSLSDDDIARLPPVFIAASTGDQDVPLKQSKRLARAAPHARMHQVYYLDHDFDRDTGNPAGAQAYEAALAFLDEAAS